MKKVILFMLLFFSSVASLKSQVDIGLKFGFNISNIVEAKSKSDIENFGELEAIHFGLVGLFDLTNNFEIQAEIFAIGKGYDTRAVGADFQLLKNYLAAPILLKYEVVPRLSILGGLEPSYTLSTFWTNGLEFQNVSEAFKNHRRFDLGFATGLAFRFAERWSVDLRYTRGVLFANSDIFRAYNRSFYFSIHRYFGNPTDPKNS
jgi:hypothetical protein